MVELFASLGFGQWLRYVTALVELAGGVLLIAGALEYLAALALAVIMVGATAASVIVFDRSPIPPALTLIALVVLAWKRHPSDEVDRAAMMLAHGNGSPGDRGPARARRAAAERCSRGGARGARVRGVRVCAAPSDFRAARELGGAHSHACLVARPVLARRAPQHPRAAAAAVGGVRQSVRRHHGGHRDPRRLQLRAVRSARRSSRRSSSRTSSFSPRARSHRPRERRRRRRCSWWRNTARSCCCSCSAVACR